MDNNLYYSLQRETFKQVHDLVVDLVDELNRYNHYLEKYGPYQELPSLHEVGIDRYIKSIERLKEQAGANADAIDSGEKIFDMALKIKLYLCNDRIASQKEIIVCLEELKAIVKNMQNVPTTQIDDFFQKARYYFNDQLLSLKNDEEGGR